MENHIKADTKLRQETVGEKGEEDIYAAQDRNTFGKNVDVHTDYKVSCDIIASVFVTRC